MSVISLQQAEKFDGQQHRHGLGAMNLMAIADLLVYEYTPPVRQLMMYQRHIKGFF